MVEISTAEQNTEKRMKKKKKKEDSLRDLWDNIKHSLSPTERERT